MTPTPDAADRDAPGWEVPADDARDEEVDVLHLAGQRPPEEGAWLWVTTADARRGGEFAALFLPRIRPRASGGDVLLHIAPGRSEGDAEQRPVPSVRVRVWVWAVAAGSLILVAGWDRLDLDGWPERVRATAAFAVGVLRELQEHGADVRAREQVEVEAAAESPAAGFPGLPAWVTPGGEPGVRASMPAGVQLGGAQSEAPPGTADKPGMMSTRITPGSSMAGMHAVGVFSVVGGRRTAERAVIRTASFARTLYTICTCTLPCIDP